MTMDAAFVAALGALALLDALNPFSIAAQAYLLGTPRPMARSIAFLLGTFATYFAAGLLLVGGANAIVERVLPRLPAWLFASAELALGIACIAGAVYLRRSAAGGLSSTPKSLGAGAAVVFAVVATATDVPTALPYFAAAGSIASSSASAWTQAGWLALYNVLYVSPMAALIALRAFGGSRVDGVFGAVQRAIDWSFAWLLPLFAAGLGLWLFGAGALALREAVG
jgi:hypothetical protein